MVALYLFPFFAVTSMIRSSALARLVPAAFGLPPPTAPICPDERPATSLNLVLFVAKLLSLRTIWLVLFWTVAPFVAKFSLS